MKLFLQAFGASAFVIWFAVIFAGCGGGESVVVSDNGHKLYVAQTLDTVARIRKYTQGSGAVAAPANLLSAGTAMALESSTRLWIAGASLNGGTNQVAVINPVTDSLVGVANNVGQGPVSLAFALLTNPPRAYVASRASGSLSVLNMATLASITTVGLGANTVPSGVAVLTSGAGPTVFVTLAGTDELAMINGTTNAILNRFPVGDQPSAVAGKPSGSEVWVTNQKGNSISILETQNYTPVTTITGIVAPSAIVFSNSLNVAFVASATSATTGVVQVIDTLAYTVLKTINVGVGPNALAHSQNGYFLYSMNEGGNVTQIDAQAWKVVATVLPGGPVRAGVIVP